MESLGMIKEVRVRALVGGILSNVPGLYKWWDGRRPIGNTASSKYASTIWKFHRDNYARYASGLHPKNVVELGPGATLATCIAALCDGADSAIGLDVLPYAGSVQVNFKMLHELWAESFDNARYLAICDAIHHLGSMQKQMPLAYFAPYTDPTVLPDSSVDLVFSHSVLEHVDCPEDTYAAFYRWLKPGGIMSHKIDHSSHQLTRSWNGHYALNNLTWKLIRGGRPYLLNRMLPFRHRELILAQGFEILSETFVRATDLDSGVKSSLQIGEDDASIKTSTFVCKKPGS